MLKSLTLFTRLAPFLVRHPVMIVAACGAFTLVLLALVATMLMQERHDAALRAADNAGNLALIVERDVARTVELFDLSLQEVVDGIQDPAVMGLPLPYRQRLLFDRSASAGKYMGELLHVDERGEIAVDSTSPVPRQGNFADRSWFSVHRDNSQAGLFISPPYQSPLRDKEWSIAFSHRVNHADGSFAGVAVGALRISHFRDLLADLKLGPHGTITLFHEDGTIIMRYPDDDARIGRNLAGTSNFERFKRARERWFFANAVLDAEQRLYVFRKFEKIPMLISVAPAQQDIFAAWNRRAWTIGAFALFLAAALMGAAWLLAEQFRYRMKIQGELLLLARKDGLTGLDNRRALDQALQNEWQRARRTNAPLSLIFIDIDRFKNFNDKYGHQAGDDALAAVAQAIGGTIRRPGDVAGRFGGEEFVMLLPDTDTAGAVRVANEVQRAIRALRIEHQSSEHHIVTVSIGIAGSDTLERELDVEGLLKAADRALYAAKAGGRNQSVVATAA